MSTSNDVLVLRISDRLRLISAKNLQALAEDMAAIACPHMFKDRALNRQGRSINGQTAKNWPDAYVLTDSNTVHGIEATRNQQGWMTHLRDDLEKAKDPENLQLSGYFFVAGYPDHNPPEADVRAWTNKFIALGIAAKNVQLLIGKHLALELADPKYARIRQMYLELPSSPEHFEEIRQSIVRKSSGALVSPTEGDLLKGTAFKPAIAESVTAALITHATCVVRGHGASGKTTLAHWIGTAPGFATTPVYKLDLAVWRDDLPVGKICNEMTELSGKEVLFIIDNVHLDEGAARALADHWRHCSKPSGSRLLLLGRAGDSREEFPGMPSKLHMQAGPTEMAGIVKYLTTKAGHPVDSVPKAVLRQWAQTFGGRAQRAAAGVDLIAFSAAVKTRTAQLAKGNWRMSEQDAIEAVQHHYLRPIKGDQTRSNLMRLAALSELEYPIPARILPFPAAGFERECIDRGLVVARNGSFFLAHPALGRLLSVAAGTDVSIERLVAGANSAVLTARILARELFPNERADLLKELKKSLTTGRWIDSCDSLHDLASVLAVSLKLAIVDPGAVDSLVCQDARLDKLFESVRSLETFTSVAGHLRSRRLPLTASRFLDFADPVVGKALDVNLMHASAGQVLAFLKNLADPGTVCAAIDRQRWNQSREAVAVDLASSTSQLVRFMGGVGQPDLAAAPARQFIQRFDATNLFSSDLGDVSNIVRYGRAGKKALRSFFDRLIAVGWLPQAYLDTTLGQLCGALMSFANHLPAEIRSTICLPEIESRIAQEARQLDFGNPASVARFTCLLGAASALWGVGFQPVTWQWPRKLAISEVYESRAPMEANDEGLGMYELQFWLGLKWLWANDGALPNLTVISLAESLSRRLALSDPPSPESTVVRAGLLDWLKDRGATGWQLAAS